ncbi:MAG: thioredoxin family protein [Pirellulales bacterium]|nr:thioredoxin family protein [Pirellulales bacterium]
MTHRLLARSFTITLTFLTIVTVVMASVAQAQDFQDQLGGFGGFGDDMGGEDVVTASGYFTVAADGKYGRLYIEAEAIPTWHFYSTTQGPGGPIPTTFKVNDSSSFKVGQFRAHTEPHIHPDESFGGLLVEEYEYAMWSAPIEFVAGTDVASLTVNGAVNAQACKVRGGCLPPTDYAFAAFLRESNGEFQPVESHMKWRGEVNRTTVAPGGTLEFKLTAATEAGWHIYELGDAPSEEIGPQPTLIMVRDLPPGWNISITPSSTAKKPADGSRPYYEGEVSFAISVEVPAEANLGTHVISGLVAFATCNEENCTPPEGLEFSREITVAMDAGESSGMLAFGAADYDDVIRTIEASAASSNEPSSSYSLWMIFGFALLGGLILNAMPCVLPVIGLKVLAIVDKTGHDRKKTFMLNVVYSVGIIAVFLILAGLSVTLNMAWGQQFQSTAFNVSLAALVWVMALSFLGVWEIPIPGFVGGSEANKLQEKEGYAGAFFRGVFTTLLATPCSGPFLGATFGYTLGQPAPVTFTIFGLIGLGMSAPYLLIGMYPKLVAWLPKPGAWMETFKQVMGFVLLGTVAFLLTFINSEYRTAVFALLISLWFACWLIGRVPITATPGRKARSWVFGVGVAAIATVLLFGNLFAATELDWEPYSSTTLAKYQKEGRTVLIDFTADWCLNCKTVERTALNQPDTKALVEKNGVIALKADWTNHDDEITQILHQYKSKSIPVLMIFPAGNTDNPTVLRDFYTKATLLEKLEEAGPSKDVGMTGSQENTTAMR